MPTLAKKRFAAWSISRLRDWEKCPAYAKWVHIDGRKDPTPNPAFARGADIHNKADLFLKGKIKKLPTELVLYKKEFAGLKKTQIGSEIKWSFDIQWQPLDGFFHPKTWLRAIADAINKIEVRRLPTADVIDFKTGKHRPAKVVEYQDQLRLYAPLAFAQYPWAQRVRGSLWFTDAGKTEKEEFDRKDAMTLIKDWNKRVRPMLLDTRFTPRPGDYCGFCHLSKRNGGPCRF